MANWNVKTAFIVGAGLSYYAGLPLTGKFTDALLEARKYKPGISRTLVEFLSLFIHDVFGHSSRAGAKYWPALEDVLTSIDLAANTGHHLGPNFAPADLRTVRRALLARTVRMLYAAYKNPRLRNASDWRKINHFFERLDPSSVGFISMNWDTVVEQKLQRMQSNLMLDYCCDALAAEFPEDGTTIRLAALPLKRSIVDNAVPIIKIHGSINWLYCDNCRELFWFHPEDAWRIADQLVGKDDLERITRFLNRKRSARLQRVPTDETVFVNCRCSARVRLGTRIATFSYRKALDFPMFQKSWLSAERLLQHAQKWIFVGYSLPAADYEFKHLLKRIQLSRPIPPQFAVITGGSEDDIASTYTNYQRFFGTTIKRGDSDPKKNFFSEGLSQEVVTRILRG